MPSPCSSSCFDDRSHVDHGQSPGRPSGFAVPEANRARSFLFHRLVKLGSARFLMARWLHSTDHPSLSASARRPGSVIATHTIEIRRVPVRSLPGSITASPSRASRSSNAFVHPCVSMLATVRPCNVSASRLSALSCWRLVKAAHFFARQQWPRGPPCEPHAPLREKLTTAHTRGERPGN